MSIQSSIPESVQAELKDDKVILKITRHWFGLAIMIGATTIWLAIMLVFFVWMNNGGGFEGMRLLTLVTAPLAAAGFLFVAVKIYVTNKFVLTNELVKQTMWFSLVSTSTSQLSLANIEDVTFTQGSLFQIWFNFGTLKIETAGEQNNFIFKYCPNPKYCTKIVLATREVYLNENPSLKN